jgi:hypothetical protein
MSSDEEFQRNVEAAERSARASRNEHHRLAYEKIAEGWRVLLKQDEDWRKRFR